MYGYSNGVGGYSGSYGYVYQATGGYVNNAGQQRFF